MNRAKEAVASVLSILLLEALPILVLLVTQPA